MRRWVKWVGAVAVVLGLLVGTMVLSWRRTKIVETFKQPASVEYPDGGRYAVRLYRITGWGTPLGLGPDHYELLLGGSDVEDYGHGVDFIATGIDPADIVVEWSTEGATIVYGSGHEVFVPLEWYDGGR
jgi:hypothetical protein